MDGISDCYGLPCPSALVEGGGRDDVLCHARQAGPLKPSEMMLGMLLLDQHKISCRIPHAVGLGGTWTDKKYWASIAEDSGFVGTQNGYAFEGILTCHLL